MSAKDIAKTSFAQLISWMLGHGVTKDEMHKMVNKGKRN